MGKIRNKDLYSFIERYYIKAEEPLTQQQIADVFGMSLGAIKNFMFRHNLNKKHYYTELQNRARDLYNKGLNVKEISKVLDVSNTYVYILLNKNYEKLKEIK